MRYPIVIALIMLGVLLSSGSASGDPVALRPALEQGRSHTYQVSRALRVEQSGAGETPAVYASSLEFTVRISVGQVRADGSLELGVEFQHVSVTAGPDGSEQRMELPHDPPAEPGENAAGVRGALDVAASGYFVSRPRLLIDREGRLTEMQGTDTIDEALRSAAKVRPEPDALALALLTPAVLLDMLTPIVQPAHPEPPSREFNPGNTWHTVRTVPLASLGSVAVHESWKVESAGGSTLAAAAEVSVKAEPPRGVVTAAPVLSLTDGSGSGELRWDVEDRTLESLSRTLNLDATLTLGDITLHQKQSSSVTIRRIR